MLRTGATKIYKFPTLECTVFICCGRFFLLFTSADMNRTPNNAREEKNSTLAMRETFSTDFYPSAFIYTAFSIARTQYCSITFCDFLRFIFFFCPPVHLVASFSLSHIPSTVNGRISRILFISKSPFPPCLIAIVIIIGIKIVLHWRWMHAKFSWMNFIHKIAL